MVKQFQPPTIKFLTLPTQIIQKDRKPGPVYETCDKPNFSTEKYYFGANAADRRPPRNRRPKGQNQVQQRNDQSISDGNFQAAAQTINWKCHVFTPELHVTTRTPTFPPFPKVVWQQLLETFTD